MKLQCQIEVINRTHKELNVRTGGKYIKSTLAIGKEPKKETHFFIIHFSSTNKSGTKYKVNKSNVKRVFANFLNEGKTTIRFEEPPHDLCIKCEPIQLKCFMKLLKSCLIGDAKALEGVALTSLGYTAKDNAPTKLVIRERNALLDKSLPRTLNSLHMNGLRMCNIRREILLLKLLTVLDLSDNEIEKVPPEFGNLPCLKELYLAKNQLCLKTDVDWKWLLEMKISKSLKLLDLSNNKLTYIPKSIWRLANLVTLKLDNNQIKKLPFTIYRIGFLRYLTISHNELQLLPCSILKCRLDYVDISRNQFLKPTTMEAKPSNITLWDVLVGDLVNLTAKVVLQNKLYYASDIIPYTLVDLLDNANTCVCGLPVVTKMSSFIKEFRIRNYFSAVVLDESGGSMVPFEYYCCSSQCYKV